jgi:hypothetical protein
LKGCLVKHLLHAWAEDSHHHLFERTQESSMVPKSVLTQNPHLAPSTQQAEQAGFTREEITRRASQFSLKINKRQSS